MLIVFSGDNVARAMALFAAHVAVASVAISSAPEIDFDRFAPIIRDVRETEPTDWRDPQRYEQAPRHPNARRGRRHGIVPIPIRRLGYSIVARRRWKRRRAVQAMREAFA